MASRQTTPPRAARSAGRLPPNPPTPEQIRKMEQARLKAKAAAQQAQALPSPAPVAGAKRTYSNITAGHAPPEIRNAAAAQPRPDQNGFVQPPSNDYIQPAKKYARSDFIDYDFSKMTDTKGGFLSTVDDPHNKAMWKGQPKEEQKPEGVTMAEWERDRIRRKLRANRAGPYEPGISILNAVNGKEEAEDEEALLLEAAENAEIEAGTFKGKYGDGKRDTKGKCRECQSLEIDWKWQDIFHIGICNTCKDKFPDKYSLLTKTEARDDYLLTDPELKDEDLLPHLERPNPHKQFFHPMQLFLRLQVEAYAFSPKKWGSAAALDEEYEKRQNVTKERKQKKFKNKLDQLKKRTRAEAYKRASLAGGEAQFGQVIKGRYDRHEHEWGRSVLDPETGLTRKRCEECGMEVEELEL
ncbi:DNA repair protein-like protein rad14 [Plenodomus tracheiphilus IPT5]|uniref:DNA repair protein RAD14 n=1 Tax=Plenodomus tracheiphilus IPT5 TaxID=1408161 RepID=A0A6A7AW01_9PLEO|nr:DNA repair protein-like protein rad14 [Plenodomus tracheiphilus IPT5]